MEARTSPHLDENEISSYAYLLAVGARLPADNELNIYTKRHLEECSKCKLDFEAEFEIAKEAAKRYLSS